MKHFTQLFSILVLLSLAFSALGVTPAYAAPTWQTVGAAGFSEGWVDYVSLAIDASGAPYVAYQDWGNGLKATVMKYNGASWETVGAAGFSAGVANFVSIAIDGSGAPYVAYTDVGNSQRATVMKYNGSSWETVGVAGFSTGRADYVSLAIDASGAPYVAYQDWGNGLKATVMKYNGSSWETVGASGFSAGDVYHVSFAIDASGAPYVAYMDWDNGLKATVMKYSGASWQTVGVAGFSTGEVYDVSLAIDASGAPYVAYMDGDNADKATVMKYNDASWETVGAAGFSAGPAYYVSLAIDGSGAPYVAYQDRGNASKATVMKYNGASWQTVGAAGFSGEWVSHVSFAIGASGAPYVAYRGGGSASKAMVMKYAELNRVVTFDPNGGSGSMAPQTASVPTPLTLNTFTRADYLFSGWNTAANGSGTPYANGATYDFAADITLYAQWTANNRVVTFDGNGGAGAMTPQVSNVPAALTLNAFTRAGYVFIGWNSAANGSGAAYANGATYSFAADITLYAQWSTGIPSPWVGGIAIQSDQPIVAVGRPHVGAEVASYIGANSGGLTQYVPMLFKGAFGGGYNAALYIQNISNASASLTMEFTNSSGEVVYTKTDTLGANASKGYWLPAEAGLPSGFAGGVKVTSNQNILAVGRPHIDGQVMTYNGVGMGSTTAWLPMFFKNGFGNYNTALYVQNVTGSSANLTIQYLNLDGTVACTDADTLAANASKGYWSLATTCDTGSLPMGFVGGVKVTSTQNILAVGRAHLGAQITTYNGFDTGMPDAYVPMLFRRAFGGTYNAALYLQNASGSSANVTIEYVNETGAVAATQNVTLAAGAISSLWLPSVAGLPDGFVGGARITSTQPVIAIGRPHLGAEITAYNGAPAMAGVAYLPMLFKNAFGNYQSAFYIQNVTGSAANVNISFYDAAGTLSCVKSVTLAPNATQGFWMPSVSCAP